MDAIVQCIEQQMASIADVHRPIAQSSVVDSADIEDKNTTRNMSEISAKSQADQTNLHVSRSEATADESLQIVPDKAEPALTSIPRLQSSEMNRPSASCSDDALRADSQSTDVCSVLFLGCIECIRCRLFLPMVTVSVCPSVTRLILAAAHAVCVGSFGAAFAKLLWPLVAFS